MLRRKTRPGKPTRTADEIRAEVILRLRASGHEVDMGSPRPAPALFIAGRNWELDPPLGLSGADRDAMIRIVRLVGNEFDCAWSRGRAAG